MWGLKVQRSKILYSKLKSADLKQKCQKQILLLIINHGFLTNTLKGLTD